MRATVIVALLLAALLLPGCGESGTAGPAAEEEQAAPPQQQAEPQAKSSDAALFEASCSTCHPIAKTSDYDGDESWSEIVTEMIEKHGARISPEDSPKIVAYLDTTYPRP